MKYELGQKVFFFESILNNEFHPEYKWLLHCGEIKEIVETKKGITYTVRLESTSHDNGYDIKAKAGDMFLTLYELKEFYIEKISALLEEDALEFKRKK